MCGNAGDCCGAKELGGKQESGNDMDEEDRNIRQGDGWGIG